MNAVAGPVPQDATIIVSGPPRGGTSFAAAALRAAGLWLGDMIDHTVFEDLEIATALQARWIATRWIDWRPLRSADSRALAKLVARRNRAFARWGFKRPGISAPLVARSGALFRHPRLVMMFRDPVALAERTAMAEGTSLDAALRMTRAHNDRNLRTARQATIPVLLASYEKAVVDRAAFYAELFDFCGLAVDPADYPRIDAFVDAAGDSYLQLAGTAVVGFLNRYTDGVLYGWCRVPERKGPETVEIFADGVLVTTARADVFRPALRQANIGRGRHGFEIRLDGFGLAPAAVIRAKAQGFDAELANSGRTLGELETASSSPLK